MTTASHAVTGAAIASAVGQPYLAIPLAFASHFACDALPHFGIEMPFGSKVMYKWLVVDGLCALGFALLLLVLGVHNPVLLAVSGFAAMSPDLAWLYYGLRGDTQKLHSHDYINKFHSWIQWYQKPPGIFMEIIWVAAMLFVILKMQ